VTKYQLASLPSSERESAVTELKSVVISDMNIALTNAKTVEYIGERSGKILEYLMPMYRHSPGNHVVTIGDFIEFSDGQLIPIPSRNKIYMQDPDFFSRTTHVVIAYKDDGNGRYIELSFSTEDSARMFFEAMVQLSELK